MPMDANLKNREMVLAFWDVGLSSDVQLRVVSSLISLFSKGIP